MIPFVVMFALGVLLFVALIIVALNWSSIVDYFSIEEKDRHNFKKGDIITCISGDFSDGEYSELVVGKIYVVKRITWPMRRVVLRDGPKKGSYRARKFASLSSESNFV